MNGNKPEMEMEGSNRTKVNIEDVTNPSDTNAVNSSDPKPKSSRRPDIDVIR